MSPPSLGVVPVSRVLFLFGDEPYRMHGQVGGALCTGWQHGGLSYSVDTSVEIYQLGSDGGSVVGPERVPEGQPFQGCPCDSIASWWRKATILP